MFAELINKYGLIDVVEMSSASISNRYWYTIIDGYTIGIGIGVAYASEPRKWLAKWELNEVRAVQVGIVNHDGLCAPLCVPEDIVPSDNKRYEYVDVADLDRMLGALKKSEAPVK